MKIPNLNIFFPSISYKTAEDLLKTAGDLLLDRRIYVLTAAGGIFMLAKQQKLLEVDQELFKKICTKSFEILSYCCNGLADYLADGKFIAGASFGVTATTFAFIRTFYSEPDIDISTSGPKIQNPGLKSLLSPRSFQEGQAVGLTNTSNNCWLNAAAQLLINTLLKDRFIQNQDPSFKKLRGVFTTYEQDAQSKRLCSPSIDMQTIRRWISEELILDSKKVDFIILVSKKIQNKSPEDFFKDIFQWIRLCGEPKPGLLQSILKNWMSYSDVKPTFLEKFLHFEATFLPTQEQKEAFLKLVQDLDQRNFDDFFYHIFEQLQCPDSVQNAFFEERRAQLLNQTTAKEYQDRSISLYTQEDPITFFENVLRWVGYFNRFIRISEKTRISDSSKKVFECLFNVPFLNFKIPDTLSKYYYENPQTPIKLQTEVLPYYFSYPGQASSKYSSHLTKLKFSETPKDLLVQIDRNFQINNPVTRVIEARGKLTNIIDHPEKIELSDEQCPRKSTFTCDAFIVHPTEGQSIDSGHYIAYVKRSGKWWECNDFNVTEITDDKILEKMQSAYILHYSLAEQTLNTSSLAAESASEVASGTNTPISETSSQGSDSEGSSSGSASPPSSPESHTTQSKVVVDDLD